MAATMVAGGIPSMGNAKPGSDRAQRTRPQEGEDGSCAERVRMPRRVIPLTEDGMVTVFPWGVALIIMVGS
jgi:hypothetical protein